MPPAVRQVKLTLSLFKVHEKKKIAPCRPSLHAAGAAASAAPCFFTCCATSRERAFVLEDADRFFCGCVQRNATVFLPGLGIQKPVRDPEIWNRRAPKGVSMSRGKEISYARGPHSLCGGCCC
eukprot:1142590-Pelagomonas_calceolata.AAC.1